MHKIFWQPAANKKESKSCAEPNADSLEKLLSNIQAYSVHTDLASVSRFESSSDELNRLWDAARNTRLNNVHSYFEDCTRERFGYGGDIVALVDSHLYSNDMHNFLKKVFMDFAYDQTPDGGIPQTAPYVGIMTNGTSNGAGSLGWQLIFPVLATRIEQHYQDTAFVQEHLPELVKHLDYLLAFDFDYIRYCCLGDCGSVDAGSFASGTQSSFIFALKVRLFRDDEEQCVIEAKLVQRIHDDAGVFRF